MIRALIVDDEPLARERIRSLLCTEEDIEILGECRNGKEAYESITRDHPDLVFLDVQMPELDGFEVLSALEWPMPAIVFVTAYDEYAIRAFDVHAVDYLLKPFDRVRFQKALSRARGEIEGSHGDSEGRYRNLLGTMRNTGRYLNRLVVRSRGRIFFVRTSEIDRIEAESNYVKIYLGEMTHLLRETMKSIEEKLEPETFLRVHRSHIVNVERIHQLESHQHGEYLITLHDGTEILSGRSYNPSLKRLLDNRP